MPDISNLFYSLYNYIILYIHWQNIFLYTDFEIALINYSYILEIAYTHLQTEKIPKRFSVEDIRMTNGLGRGIEKRPAPLAGRIPAGGGG